MYCYVKYVNCTCCFNPECLKGIMSMILVMFCPDIKDRIKNITKHYWSSFKVKSLSNFFNFMKTFSNINSCLYDKNVCRLKTSTRSYNNFTWFCRKRNGKDVLANYNKTGINIGHQPDRWMELKDRWEFKLMLKC